MALDLQPLGEPSGSSSLDLQPLGAPQSLDDGYAKLWSKTKDELHGIEDATNRVVGGGLGFVGALLPTAAHRINEHIQGRGNQSSFEEDFNTLSDKIAKGLVPATAQEAPASAEKYNDFAGDVMNRAGFAMIGVHGAIPYAKNLPRPKEFKGNEKFSKLDKLDTAPKQLDLQPLGEQQELPLENNPQQIAEMQGRGTGQPDLFAPQNADVGKADIAPPIQPQVDLLKTQEAAAHEAEMAKWREAHQMEIDPTPEGYKADQYGGGQDGMRIDENGMPIRADRSMEAANLENPLQRNLWGDELPRQSEQEAARGITSAIDKMPAGEARQAGINMLSNGPRSRQRGSAPVINDAAKAVEKWFTGAPESLTRTRSLEEQSVRKNAESQRAGPGHYISQSKDLAGVYGGPNGRLHEVHEPFKKAWDLDKPSLNEDYHLLQETYGTKAAANKILQNRGFDAITFTNGRGEKIANIFNSKEVTDIGPSREAPKAFGPLELVPKNQRGHAPIINHLAALIEDTAKKGSEALKELHGKLFNLYAEGGYKDQALRDAASEAIYAMVNEQKKENYVGNINKPIIGVVGPNGETFIPSGTRVVATHGVKYKEPTRGTVVGEKQIQINGQPHRFPVVDFGDGDPRTLGYGDVKQVFSGPKNQRGSAPIINDMAKALMKGVDAVRDTVEAAGKVGLHHLTSKEDYISKNIPGMKESLDNRITAAPKAEDIIKAGMDPKVQDIPKQGIVSSNIQSGLQQMSTKYRDNPVLLGAGRILDNMYTKTEYQIRQLVKPVMEHMQLLHSKERMELTQLFTREMFNEKRYTKDELRQAGFSAKQVEAYDMLRAAHDEAFNMNNRGRDALGKEPITKGNAYLASMRQGDWQFSVLDKQGKAAWYVRSTTKAEALAAIDHLKKNFGDSLQLDKVAPEFRKESSKYHPDTPRDVMGAYQDMLRYFDDNPALSKEISESMKSFAEKKGYDFAGHKSRFLDKANVRGFEGDKPWLSDRENSNALLKAQENYLKNTIQWNHAQEAVANMKKILSDEQLNSKMPNAVDMVQKVFDSQFGMSKAVTAAVENVLAQMIPAYSHGQVAMGRSSSSLYRGTGGIKTALYLQLLGLNLTHMIATPIQGMITGPANHAYLSHQGFEHNVFKTTMNALSDFSTGMMQHLVHSMSGKDIDIPMTKIGKAALKFAEDNGVINKNLFNESVDLGSNTVGRTAKAVGGFTIALPEKVTRLATFMSMVHHLDASGKLSQMEVFQKAKEFTDNSLTGFSRQDRPMIVDKAGSAGSLAYTFKSYLFNYYNQLSTHARVASQGNVKPLAYNLGMLAAVGGVLSVPMVNEADGAWNVFKDFIATHAPEHYNAVKGRGLKDQIITHLPDVASYGLASDATGIGMQNKFGTDVADPERPFKNVFPMAQDVKEAVAGVGALTHLNKTTATEAVYQQMPKLVQGQMERHMDVFKGPKQQGGQIAYNPNKLGEPTPIDHLRTESDWTKRSLGMTSLAEAKDKQTGYSNSQEDFRIKEATQTLGAHVFDAAVTRKNPQDTKEEIIAYLKLNPDGNALKADFEQRLNKAVLTPSQRQLIGARTYQQIDNVMRLRGTRGQP